MNIFVASVQRASDAELFSMYVEDSKYTDYYLELIRDELEARRLMIWHNELTTWNEEG